MAITKETIRSLIKEGQETLGEVELYNRPYEFEENGRYVLVGVRQAGKSYMLYKRAKQLLASGRSLEEMVYIDFDDERLLGMTAADLDLILQAYGSVYSHRPILFFDEIQNVDGWEHFARRLANQKYQVFITGSNAKMLSRDIQTTLGGRYLDGRVFPYSFAEYLAAQGIALSKEWQHGKVRSQVQQAFTKYLLWGGFPELLLYRNKRRWLNDLYEKILLGDVIQRNKVKNEMALRLTIKRLADNVMQPTSYNRIANLVKGTGVSTSVASVIDYVRYAKEACMLFPLDNYASKFVEKETVKKHYFVDNGLLSIFLIGGETALLENLCAVHLYKKYEGGLYFYNKGIEVDFVVPDESYAVQVSYSISDEDTRKREVDGLKKLHAFLPLKRMVIVTFDEEETVKLGDGCIIEVIPAWKWLLE
ncbi:MAG: ATP-binding protein [Bacteroidaceae bacterium]|nr:ATP-binding protein [Bacteroidaceae bacterium]